MKISRSPARVLILNFPATAGAPGSVGEVFAALDVGQPAQAAAKWEAAAA